MPFRRLIPSLALLYFTGIATGQTGPQLTTVFPPGAKAGETTEITVTGIGFDGDESLLFSNKALRGELVPGSASTAKQPQPKTRGALTTMKFKVTAPKDVRPGTLDVRVVSKAGLSNPRAFVVSRLAEINEKEPNNDAAEAQKVELETTVNGVIASPTDVDFVAVRVKGGQNVVVACLATSIDSRLQADLLVIGPDGRPIAANRGYRDGDAVLDFLAPADGEYLVRVAQFAYTTGGTDHFYRLTVSTGPWIDAIYPPVTAAESFTVYGRNLGDGKKLFGTLVIAAKPEARFTRPDGRPLDAVRIRRPPVDTSSVTLGGLSADRPVPPPAFTLDAFDTIGSLPVTAPHLCLHGKADAIDNESNDTPEKAQPVKVPGVIAGRIEKRNDRDWYAFEAKKGEILTLELFADRIGSPADAYFTLTDAKGKTIAEVDDSLETLSPNQFYTKSDDPGRYRFTVPADGTYRVMVATREAAVQFGVRDQYVLRIENRATPRAWVAVMSPGTHFPDAGTLPKGGAVLFTVFVSRTDGYDGAISLQMSKLPRGVHCPSQVIGPGQTRGTLVLTADKDAADWAGFVEVEARPTDGEAPTPWVARPFTIVWPVPGLQPNQPPPNSPMITRMDRGPGLALAIRGEPRFRLTPTSDSLKVKAGEKVEVTLKVDRKDGFKDPVQVISGTPDIGPRQQRNQPPPALGTAAPGQAELKVSLDVPANLPGGTYTLVLLGRSGAPQPKGPNAKLLPSYPAAPITLTVTAKEPPRKKK